MSEATTPLTVRALSVGYGATVHDADTVVWDVDLALERGRILGLAGESGCGKSTTALAAVGYRAPGMQILGGQAMFGDIDLLQAKASELRQLWGRHICYVPQAASMALNPAMTIGAQLAEPLRHHAGMRGAALLKREVELLEQVGLPSPEAALRRYPHQFSGGQQQRINLAIALSCEPSVVLLDEPTTGLDVTTQKRITALLKHLVEEYGLAVLYVSHDLALLGTIADRIAVMYAGQVVEEGTGSAVVARPSHPYAQALVGAVPDPYQPRSLSGIPGQPPSTVQKQECPFAPRCPHVIDACRAGNPGMVGVGPRHSARCIRVGEVGGRSVVRHELARTDASSGEALLTVGDLWCDFRGPRGRVAVVRGVSLEIRPGETVGIVGESGSGKSTLLKAIAGLHPWSTGRLQFEGRELAPRAVDRSRESRRDLQLVFQNPDSSLNPRHTVMAIVARPIRLFRSDVDRSDEVDEVRRLLDSVQLSDRVLYRYPSELSGGQKQRIALARAFAARPRVLLCDEVTSALDVSVQAAMLELIAELSSQFGTAVAFVTHDLGVVRTIAHRALVMLDGEVCEEGTTDSLFMAPRHEYTRELVRSVPELSRQSGSDGLRATSSPPEGLRSV